MSFNKSPFIREGRKGDRYKIIKIRDKISLKHQLYKIFYFK